MHITENHWLYGAINEYEHDYHHGMRQCDINNEIDYIRDCEMDADLLFEAIGDADNALSGQIFDAWADDDREEFARLIWGQVDHYIAQTAEYRADHNELRSMG